MTSPTSRRTRRSEWPDRLLWLWPVFAVVAMALAGQVFAGLGTLLTGIVIVAVLVLFVGMEAIPDRQVRIWVSVGSVLLAMGVLVAHHAGVAFLATSPARVGQGLDLRGRQLSQKDIEDKDLRGALLAGATLDGLDLRDRDLTGVRAPGASFKRAVLDRARLVGSDLRGADLSRACLHRAVLTDAILDGADATEADVTEVVIDDGATRGVVNWPDQDSRQRCG